MNISFDEAIPTKTHMALKKLVESSEYWQMNYKNIMHKVYS